MKAISLHQPWASLVAMGVKRIETRSWSTPYRGPLAIHATRAETKADVYETGFAIFEPLCVPGTTRLATPMPFGAVVATCNLLDVVPMVENEWDLFIGAALNAAALGEPNSDGVVVVDTTSTGGSLRLLNLATARVTDIEDQRPYGDFTPGRFAWLLADIKPLAEPIPARGRQGLWNWSES